MTNITPKSRRQFLRASAMGGAAALAAPAIATAQGATTTWRVQTSWPGGAGLQIFKDWCGHHRGKDRRRAGLPGLRRQ
jgi:TRAP-type mannitol/chloroaromatic compound transport system substrate-binding protein